MSAGTLWVVMIWSFKVITLIRKPFFFIVLVFQLIFSPRTSRMPQNTISSLRCSCQEFRFSFPWICDTSEYALLFSVLVHAKGGLCTLQVKYKKYVLVKCTVYRNTEYLMADRIFETFYNPHKHIFITDHSVSCNSSSQIFIELSSITYCPYFFLYFLIC